MSDQKYMCLSILVPFKYQDMTCEIKQYFILDESWDDNWFEEEAKDKLAGFQYYRLEQEGYKKIGLYQDRRVEYFNKILNKKIRITDLRAFLFESKYGIVELNLCVSTDTAEEIRNIYNVFVKNIERGSDNRLIYQSENKRIDISLKNVLKNTIQLFGKNTEIAWEDMRSVSYLNIEDTRVSENQIRQQDSEIFGGCVEKSSYVRVENNGAWVHWLVAAKGLTVFCDRNNSFTRVVENGLPGLYKSITTKYMKIYTYYWIHTQYMAIINGTPEEKWRFWKYNQNLSKERNHLNELFRVILGEYMLGFIDEKSAQVPFDIGKNGYVFISYSHKDWRRVYPILFEMYEAGIHFWYDKGIETGKNWDEEVLPHLKKCRGFVSFVSKNYFLSNNSIKECKFLEAQRGEDQIGDIRIALHLEKDDTGNAKSSFEILVEAIREQETSFYCIEDKMGHLKTIAEFFGDNSLHIVDHEICTEIKGKWSDVVAASKLGE